MSLPDLAQQALGLNQLAVDEKEFRLRALAEQGDAAAQTSLGLKYSKGDGVPKDLSKAFEWFQKAAEQGNADAQSQLGWMYFYNESVVQDLSKAFEWFQKAA